MLARLKMKEGKIQEAISYYFSGIAKWEEMRGYLRDNDEFKISFSDKIIHSYRDLSVLLCAIGNPTQGLYVSEQSRARALADLMLAQYSVATKVPTNPRTWAGLEDIVGKKCNSTCLYISYRCCHIYLWIIKAGKVSHF